MIKDRDSANENDALKRKIIDIEVEENKHKIKEALYYFNGAIKKIEHNYFCIEQIMKSNGYNGFDEIDFEKEEEEYHIKTAIIQSIRVVRMTSRIDQGNQEYLEQCGINPAIAEKKITGYLIVEQESIRENKYDKTTRSLYDFLEQCYQDYKGLSKKRLEKLGVKNGFMKDVMFELNGSQKKILKLKDRQMLKPNKEVSDG